MKSMKSYGMIVALVLAGCSPASGEADANESDALHVVVQDSSDTTDGSSTTDVLAPDVVLDDASVSGDTVLAPDAGASDAVVLADVVLVDAAPDAVDARACLMPFSGCSAPGQCCAGLSCRAYSSSPSASTYCCQEAGGSCSRNVDCCGSMGCHAGSCTCVGPAGFCSANADCCSGVCAGSSSGMMCS